jgi:hypothetical protein
MSAFPSDRQHERGGPSMTTTVRGTASLALRQRLKMRLLCHIRIHRWGVRVSDGGPGVLRTCTRCGVVREFDAAGSGPGGMEQRPYAPRWWG